MSSINIYGLIGRPLGHSFSREFFTRKFERENINAEYLNFELPDIGDLMEMIAEYPRLKGFNVTIPYKQAVIPYLDSLNETAEGVGAVNVVKIIRDDAGEILEMNGYNSDVIGFRESIRPLLKSCHDNALVLGTGGASKAVVYALKQMGLNVTLVSRTHSDEAISYGELTPEIMAAHKVVVNTTPLGMYPEVDACPDIPYDLITEEHVCFDLVYNPGETLFMKLAATHGATVKNGLEMLHLQALEAWRIWND